MRDGSKPSAWPGWGVGVSLASLLLRAFDGDGRSGGWHINGDGESGEIVESTARRLPAPNDFEERGNGHTHNGARGARHVQSIVKGVDELVDARLAVGFGEQPHYRHKESCQQLSAKQPANFDGGAFVADLYGTIEANGLARLNESAERASEKNWRWAQITEISDRYAGRSNGAAAKLDDHFERLVATLSRLPDSRFRDKWANQVLIAAGLTNPKDAKRCIDLMHDCGDGAYDFIGLRSADDNDNPLRAAIDLLIDGLIYVFSRVHRDRLGYDPSVKRVLSDDTRQINLRVVAPEQFYKQKSGSTGLESFYKLGWFEGAINTGLARFSRSLSPAADLGMGFRFEAIKDNFLEMVGDHGFRISFVPQPVHSLYPKLGLFRVNVPSVPRSNRQ
jgi:hypothetical protein